MADDTNPAYLAGLIVGIKEHLDRQDQQHAQDKAEAIAARDQKHLENIGRFNELGVRIDKVDARVTALEMDRDAKKNQAKGEKRAYAAIYAVIGAIVTGIGALLGPDAIELLKRFFGHQGGGTRAKGAAAGGALALAIGLVAYFEGTVKHTYIDPAGIPTICTGHTGSDVKPGMTASDEMCRDFLASDMASAFQTLDDTVPNASKLDLWVRGAMASFIYNLGPGTWKASPIPQLLAMGRVKAACDALLPYNMARVNGKLTALPGLIKRREAERHLCLGEPWSG